MTYFTGISRVMFILSFLFLISCTGPYVATKQASGVYHRVKKGETLYTIAQAYKVNAQYLAEVNNIDNINLIERGRVLFIPDAQQVLEDTSYGKGVETEKRSISKGKQPQKKPLTKKKEEVPSDEQTKITFDKRRFVWPVQGKVISRFGIQPNGMFMNGIKIAAPEGSQVVAAADGTVIFSAPLKDYGETIILKHDDDFATVYSYMGQGLVKLDEHVKKSDRIGILAKSEPKGGGLVHFEVRLKNKARNPVFYLP